MVTTSLDRRVRWYADVVGTMPARAAAYVDSHLWTRSSLTLHNRRRLIALAVSRTAPSAAVAQLTLQVFRHTAVCAAWHSQAVRTTDELADVLRDTAIHEHHLEAALGANWSCIVAGVAAEDLAGQ